MGKSIHIDFPLLWVKYCHGLLMWKNNKTTQKLSRNTMKHNKNHNKKKKIDAKTC